MMGFFLAHAEVGLGAFLSPSGKGGSAEGRVGEGDVSTLAEASPSSGAARHLLPEGEKNRRPISTARISRCKR